MGITNHARAQWVCCVMKDKRDTKLMLLVVLFFFAFFIFTLSIRYYNHAGFMINIFETHDPTGTPQTVADTLNHGALHYTMGMRGFYLAVPISFWLFGPLWMLGGQLFLVCVLFNLRSQSLTI